MFCFVFFFFFFFNDTATTEIYTLSLHDALPISAPNAKYTPTAAEIAAGSVTLTLTTNDPVGPCPALSDQMKITIDPITVVNAGPDQTVCSSSPQVQLQGSVSGTVTTGTWSGGAGSFSPSNGP